MVQQGVDQGPVGGAGRGMDGHAGRLVDHDQLVVLVEDHERDVLGRGLGRLGRRNLQVIDAGRGLGGGACGRDAVARHAPGGDQALDSRAGEVRRGGRQGLVEALAGKGFGDFNAEDFG